jgi:hypothetical protein
MPRAAARQVRDGFKDIYRLTPLMAALLAATALPGFAQVAANPNALVLRQGVGQTATSLAVNGTTTDVRTNTIYGTNAFNSFTRFEVGGGNTVNLHLPTGTSNLVNLVSDSAVRVNGTVNSLLSSGRVGGHVIFADPYGFVVGTSGVLNVGSLAVSTPSMAGMDRLFGAAAGTDAAAVADLQAGRLGLSSLGGIRIEGQVNALDSVTLQAGDGEGNGANAIDVSGTVRAGGAGRTQVAVNVGGSQAVELVQSEGRIVLTAGGDIKVTGKLLADGDPWAKAGAIRVTAGQDLALGGTAQISASSNTGNAAGGDVYLWGERNATAGDGVQISARASGSGDGGRIEISGRKSVDIGRVSFDASSPQGKAGEAFIDPDDLTISDARVSAGTNFSAQADNSITVSGSITTTNPDGDSGNITLTAPNITLTSTGLLDASASAGYTAGDVTLTASKPANFWFPEAASNASINIDGVIKGKNISANVDARVNNGQTAFMTGLSLMTDLADIFLGGMPINGAYIPATANASIDLGSSANLSATGAVKLSSYAERKAIYTSNASSGNLPFAISVLVGNLTGTTSVNVGSGASISAGGAVDISAASKNITKLISNAVSGISKDPATGLPEESTSGSGVGVALTISMVDTATTIGVASGAHIGGTSISALARNENSSQTETNAIAFGANAAMGAALTVAINKNDVSTKVGGTLTASTGDVSLGAMNLFNTQGNGLYNGHSTKAVTQVVKEENKLAFLSDAIGYVNDDGTIDKSGASKAAALGALGLIWEKYGATKSDKASTTTASPIKAAAAVVYDTATISSTVEVRPDAVISAVNGHVVALANSTHADLSLMASSEAVSKMDDPASASSKLAVSAGLVVGAEKQNADVLIGNNAQITAQKIGLSATTEMPLNGIWTDKWAKISSITDTLATAKRLNDTFTGDGFQSNVNAEASGDAAMAIAGAVMVVSSDARASAWVDHHATLVATAAVPADTPWVVKPYDDHPAYGVADVTDWSFGKSVNVLAGNDQQSVNVGGNGADLFGGVPSSTGKSAVGATFNWLEQTNSTIAGIGDFVTVTAPSVAVNADTATWMLAVSPTAGSGGGMGLNGVGAMIWLENTTHASISKKAFVTADEVEIVANQGLSLWSATGSISSGTQGGVGLAIAYSDISADTRAYVGDNSADHPGTGYTTAGVTLGSEAAGLISTDSLKVEALSEGLIGTVSVSLAAAGSKPAGTSAPASGSDAKASGPLAALTGMLAFLPGMSEMTGKAAAAPAAAPASAAAAAPAPAPAPAPPEPPPKFSIAAAGAAAVTITNVDTVATIDGATVQRKAASGVSNTTVLALSNVDQISVAGGGALSMSTNPATKSNTGVGVAIGVQMNKAGGNGNETRASIVNSTLTGQGADHVQALSGGDLISVGIGATGQFSVPSTSNYALAGSVSVTQLANVVSATVTNSTLTAASGSSTDLLDVVAYDRTRVGTGGGALTIGGSKGAGAAVTYTDLANTVHAGVSGSTVTNFEAVDVLALSNNRIIAGALVATVTLAADSTTIGGAAVINKIANTVSAEIQDSSSVTGATTVTVSAAGAPNGSSILDAAIGQKHDNGVVDLEATNSEGGYSDEFKSAAQGGDAIIGVAGAIQSSSSSVGLSYVGNIISNTYDAAIEASTVTASGAVSVTAKSTAKIIGVAAGLGVSTGKFAGVGSATSNIIGSNVTAAVRSSASVTAGSLNVDAGASSGIISVAGSVAISTKGNAGGAALTYNQTGAKSLESGSYNAETNVATRGTTAFGASGVQALVDHSTVNVAGGAFAVQAKNTGDIKTMAATGTVAVASGGTAVSGALTWNDVGDTAKALVNSSTVTAATSSVQVGDASGGVSASIASLAGALAISGGGSGFGGAFAINDITSTRSATAVDSTFILTGGATFDANSSASIQTLSAAVAASKDSAMGISFGLNMIDASLEAGTTGGSITGATSVLIHAQNSSDIGATAGAVGLSLSGSAMGGALSNNLIGSQGGNAIKAGISGGSITTTGDITVNAEGTQTIGSIAIAGSGASSLALAGSVTGNAISTAITSSVSSATLSTGALGDVHLMASDTSSISSMAPALAVGGSTGVGVSIAVNRIGTETSAALSGGSVRSRDLILDAEENASIKTVAIGVGAGGSNGGAGSVVVNILTGSTEAKIENGADVLAQGDVAVLANDSARIEAVGGAAAIGLGASALGAVSVTNLLQNTTDAHITGASTTVSALSLGGRSLTVNSATLASAPDLSTISGVDRAVLDDAAAFGTRSANGVVVNATALQRIGTVAVNVSGSGGPAAVALLASVDAVSGSTKAYIESATINSAAGADSSQTVDVQAANHAMVADFSSGAAAAFGGVGVNATVASVSIDRTTDAHIKTGIVKAAGAVKVNARSSESEVAFSFGIGGGLFGGVSANAASALIESQTLAYVGDEDAGSNTTSVQAGSLSITARADNMINLIAGGVAGGAVGIGASVGVGLLGSTVKAYGSHLTTNISGALSVTADTENKLQSVVVNAAAGVSSGASFMAAVNIIDSETQAYLNSVSQTSSTPTSITVAGTENLTLGSYGGALGAGAAAGIGVSANVAIAKSTLLAEILNSSLTSTGAISVTADRNATADMVTATGGLSPTGPAISGSVGVVVLGGAPDSNTNNTLDNGGDGTLSKADTSANSDRTGDSNGTMTADETSTANSKSSYAVKSSVNGSNAQGSAATVVGSTLIGSSLTIRAHDENTISNGAGAVAVGGSAGAGAGIAVSTLGNTASATMVGGSATTSGDVAISASSHSSIETYAITAAASGSLAVGASLAVNHLASSTLAGVSGTTVRARDLLLDAESDSSIKTIAIGVGAGAGAGGAGSVVVNILTGSTEAKIENGADVLAQGDVAVLADDSARIEAVGGALAIGAGASAIGAVSVTNLLQNTTDAHITGASTSVSALSLGGRSLTVNGTTLASAPDLSTISGVNRSVLDNSAAFGTRTANGVVVNATALQRIGTVAVNVSGSGGPAAVALLASVDAVSGSTTAYIENATINSAAGADSSQTVDVQAANHAMVADFSAGAAVAAGGGGANATVATVSIDRVTDAHIKTGTVKAAGAVNVNARSSAAEVAFSFGVGGGLFGGVSANAASALIESQTLAYVGDDAAGSNTTSVQAGSLSITARADNMINLIAGGVAGGAVGLGASVGVGLLGSTVKAYGSHLTTNVSGALAVSADTENKLQSVVVNAAAGASGGASFMAAVNIMDSDTEAYLNSVSQTGSTPTSITVAGTENLTLGSYGGALGAGGSSGIGVSANVAIAKSTLLAEILNSSLTSTGAISVTADRNATAELVTATAGLSGGVSIAGSVGVVVLGGAPDSNTNNTLDSGGSGTLSKADTSANSNRTGESNGAMTADETATTNSKGSYALKSSVNGSNAQGATATVVSSTLRGSSLTIRAVDNNTITNGAGAVAVGLSAGAGAGIAVSILGNTASATMVGGSATTTGNVSVNASNESDINTYAVTAAASAGLGFAASIGVNQLATSTQAGVSGSTVMSSAGSVLLNASSTDVIKTVGVGAAVAGGAAAAGSVVVNTLTSNTSAFIDSSATVTAYNNVGVLAFTDDSIEASGGALGVGVGAVGIGAVSVVNTLKSTTDAHISGAGTVVTANANDVSYITEKDSTLSSTPDLSGITGVSRAVFEATSYNTRNARGLVVNAASLERVGSVGVNVAASLGAAAGVVINVDQVAGSTKAYIDGARTTSGKDVDVRAADNALVADFATGVSVGGAGAVNGALNTVLMSRSTQAYINGGSTTASSGAVAVNARSTQAEAVLSAGLGGGAFAGVSATSSVGRINSETLAYVNNNTLGAASLDVSARGENLLHIISGSVGVGFVGVGGSVGVAISDSTVKAYVDNSTLSVTGALGVNASTVTSLDQTVVNAGAGVVGVGIMAGVALLSNTTEARMQNDTQAVNASAVTVAASDTMTVSDKGGSSAFGAVGVGASVNVLVASSRTDAKVIDSTLKASGAVNVTATREADLQLYTMTASAGLVDAVSASVGVIALGQAPNSETNSDTSGSVGNVNSVTTANRTGDTNGAMSSSDTTSSNSAASYQTQTKINAGAADATTATITGGSVTSAGLNVLASQHVDTVNMAGGIAGGYFGSGAGAAVAVTSYGSAIDAHVSGTTVSQGGNTVTVQAVSDNKNSGPTRDKANNVISFAGGGGSFVGLGAAVGIATNNTAVNAGLAGTVTAGAINVSANDSASVQSRAVGAAYGSGAIGVARADATNTGSVTAELGGSINTTGAVNITASRSGDTAAYTVAGAAGIISGAGADAHATSSGNVTARINDSANINGAGRVVSVSASDSADANAQSIAASVAVAGTVGVSTSTATLNANVTAKLGSNVSVTAAELDVASASDGTGVSYSTAAGGGLLFGANAVVSQTNVGGAVLTQVGGGSVFNVTGDVDISAADTLSGRATSNAVQLGFVAAGAAVSQVTVSGSLTTDAGGVSGITGSVGGSLNVSTSGQESAEANATAGSGGVIAGAAAVALTDTSRTTSTQLTYGNAGSVATAGAINISAEDTANVTGHVNSLQASLVGAAGGSVTHTVNKSVAASLGNASNLSTHSFEITSNNAVVKPSQDSDVSAGSGGVVGAAAALSTTNITGLSSLANIGNSARVTVTGTNTDPGSFNVAASNEVDAVASVKMSAAGLLVGAGGEASINATGDSSDGGLLATASMGTNSSVDVFGNITFSALSRSNVDASASTNTYGLAAAAQGDANAKIVNTNNVTMGTGSTIAGTAYVSFLAGVDSSGRTNVANANSSVDLYNKTAFPISITPSPTSEVDVNNNITINASSVRTAGTVYLTTDEGTRITKAKGVGKDLYTEALMAAAGAFGIDLNLELTGGNASHNNVNGVVTVNGGTIEAGANNIQRITFDANGNVVTGTKVGNITYTKSVEDLIGNGVAYLNKLYGQRSEYGSSSQIDALITYYEDQLVGQGFADRVTDNGNTFVTARDSVPSNFITLNDVYAKSGNIVVAANRFGGTGSLIANADNEITITNNSPYQLRVKDLIIDSTGGFIKYNGSNVRTNADIAALNPRTGTPVAAFGAMQSIDPNAAAGSVQPIITVSSNWSPTVQAACTSDADCDAKMASDPLYEDRGRSPDIRIAGHLYNRLGAVNVANANGSVIIAPDIAGYTPLIEGATTNVTSGREVFLDSPSAFYSIGGDPKSLYLGTFTADDKTRVANAGLNGNVCASGDLLNTVGNPIASLDTGCYHAGTGGIFATGGVFLSAKYLNINGTVQSGQPDWSATLSSTLNASMNTQRSNYLRYGGTSRFLIAGNLSAGIPNTYYNAATDRIEVAPTAVTGGSINLVGYVMNTGGGQIKVMDGRGHIAVTNNTNRAIDILGLDAGDVSGKVVITDLGKTYSVGGKTVNAVTTIKSVRDANNAATYSSVTTKGAGGAVVSTTSSGSRTGFNYNPLANTTYSWLSGFSKSIKTHYYWKSSSYLWGASGGWDKSKATDTTITGDPSQPPIPLVEAEYVSTTTPGTGKNFNVTWRTVTTDSATMTGSKSWHKCGFLCFKRTNYRTEDWVTGKKDYFTTSVRADNAIPISFIGYDSGLLNVTSLTGDINIAGAITNKFGAVNLTSTGGRITQSATAAQVTADSISLVSAKGVGTDAAPINAQVLGNAGGTGFSASATTSGNIVVNSLGTADLLVGRISTPVANGGHVTVNAYKGIIGVAQTGGAVNIQGAKIDLNSTVGAIGSAGTALTIKTRDDSYLGGLTATAAQDINIKQTTGNLWLNTVASSSGNVTIEAAAGSIYDGNHTAVRDQRTYDELLGAWNKMSLRSADPAANAAALQVQLDAVKIRNNQAYKDYWTMRGTAAYNPDFQYSASASEITALGLDTSAKVVAYNSQKTSLYQTTHARLAVNNQDAAFNADYSYTLTAQETGDLSTGSSWTDAQLATSMPKGLLFKENTNSITLIKENNVSSNLAVTLKASGTIGRYDGQMIIDPRTPMSDDQKVALTAAETKDVSFQYFNSSNVLLGSGSVALSNAISTRNTLQAKKNAGGTLTASETTELASYTAMNLPNAGGYNKIAVNQNSALNTKSAQLTAQANGFVYLSSLDNSINIKSVTSGLATGDGNIRVTSLNNIYNVAGTGVVAISGRGAILEAANGVIGTAEAPLLVNLGAGTLTARSAGNMYITQSALNTMNVAAVYSPSNVFLTAASGIRDARGVSPLAIKAANINLSSSAGTVGTAANPLAVATVDTSATGGVVNATASGANMGIYLTRDTDATDTTNELRVGTLSAKGDIEVSSLAGLRVVGSITGGTTTSHHLTLQAGRDMAIDGKVTETGTLSLIASGNPATVTQREAFTANALSLSGSTAAFSLWQPGNQFTKLAANVGSLTLRDLDGYAITSVVNYPAMGLASSTLNGITASGGVYLTAAPMLGVKILKVPTVTQDQAIVAGSLNLFGDNAVFNLGLGTNRLIVGSTPGSLTGKVSGLVFASNSAYSLSDLTGLSSLNLTVGTGVTATGVATLSAASPLTTPLLTLNGPGSFNLLSASQNVAKVQTGTGALGLNTLSYRSDRLGALGALVASSSITLSSTGSLAQVAGTTVVTPTLTLQGVSGSYDLSLSNNNITNLLASTANVRLRDDNGFNLSSASLTGTLRLQSTSNVTQSEAITASQLDLNGTNANYQLGGYNNVVGTLKGATTTVTYRGDAKYALGALSFTTLDLTSNGTVSQVGALTGTALSTLKLQGTGQFLLGSFNNNVGTLSNVGTATAINFLDNTGFIVGAVNTTALTLQSNGVVTQTAAITAPTLTLATASGAGDFRLNSFNNTLGSVSGKAGALSLRDDGGLTLGALSVTNLLTLATAGSSVVNQTAAIKAASLQLGATGAANTVGGIYTLNTYANSIGKLWGAGTSLALWDASNLAIGGTVGLSLSGVLSLKSTASVTATATNLSASQLALVGTTGIYDLTAALNATTTTSMFASTTGTGASLKLVKGATATKAPVVPVTPAPTKAVLAKARG